MPHQAVDSLPYWLAFFAWVGQQRYVLWKEQVARLSGAMGAVLGVGRHACRLGADPAIVNRLGEDGIELAVEIRFQIGRAACRERVCRYVWISVVAVSLKK